MTDGARCGVLPGQALVAIAGKNQLEEAPGRAAGRERRGRGGAPPTIRGALGGARA